MDLKTQISNVKVGEELSAFNTLLDKAKIAISSWGGRSVSIEGYEGSVSLRVIANKANQIGVAYFKKEGEMSDSDRIAGMDLAHKVNELQKESDEQVKEKGFLTRILAAIRGFFSTTCTGVHFRCMTDEQIKAKFSGTEKKDLIDGRPIGKQFPIKESSLRPALGIL